MGPFEQAVEIGREWDSVLGRRKVIGVQSVRGADRVVISTEGQPYPILLPPAELEAEIRLDQKNFESHKAAAEAAAKQKAAEDERNRLRDDTDGFADRLSPMAKRRAIEALSVFVRNNGRVISRKELIRELVRKGYVVNRLKGRIEDPKTGVFLTLKDVTKTGMDYAEFLIRKS